MRGKPTVALRSQLIPPIDLQLGQLQQELIEIAGLKAGNRWREKGEKGEKDAGFLKKLFQRRTTQQYISAIKRPNKTDNTSVIVEAEIPTDYTSDPVDMRNLVQQFYQQLYMLDHVDDTNIDQYLESMQFTRKVTDRENTTLMAKIAFDDLLEQVKRCSKQSSPGEDGLGYQYLQILFNMPILRKLILEMYNNALTAETIPLSWKDIRVRLLPKKGDLTDLKNWRPISLINCDAKNLSRVINSRIGIIANKIMQSTQTGFMTGHFIDDNGLLLHLLINQARFKNFHGISLLLDQEKAYDRVNPQYLLKVLKCYGFKPSFIQCIVNFFFGNLVQINVNGFM